MKKELPSLSIMMEKMGKPKMPAVDEEKMTSRQDEGSDDEDDGTDLATVSMEDFISAVQDGDGKAALDAFKDLLDATR